MLFPSIEQFLPQSFLNWFSFPYHFPPCITWLPPSLLSRQIFKIDYCKNNWTWDIALKQGEFKRGIIFSLSAWFTRICCQSIPIFFSLCGLFIVGRAVKVRFPCGMLRLQTSLSVWGRISCKNLTFTAGERSELCFPKLYQDKEWS